MLAAAATVDVKKMLVYLKEQLMSVLHYTHTRQLWQTKIFLVTSNSTAVVVCHPVRSSFLPPKS